MDRHAVVEAHVEHDQRNVESDVERPVPIVGPYARQPEALGLVAGVEIVLRVVYRVEPDLALVDVGAGEIHHVVVVPEERLLLPVVVAGREVQVELVDEAADRESLVLGPEDPGVVRVAVRLRRGVRVVQVGEGPEARVAEVLPVQVQRILVERVPEPDQHRPAVLGVDHRAGEDPVERVDRRRWQGSQRAGRERVAGRVEGRHVLAVVIDRTHLRGGPRVRPDLVVDEVDDRVGQAQCGHPELVGLVAEGVLLADARAGRRVQGRDLGRRQRPRRSRHQQRVGERVQDQWRGRERLDVELVAERDRGRSEHAVRTGQPTAGQSRRQQHLAGRRRRRRRRRLLRPAAACGGTAARSGPQRARSRTPRQTSAGPGSVVACSAQVGRVETR